MINKKRLVNRFIRYVKVDSLSRQEGKFAALIKRELSGLGLKPVEDNAGRKLKGESGNIFAAINGNNKGLSRILLNAHLDTVPPGRNIRPRIRKGRIVTDGRTILGADNKAGVAVIMEVLEVIIKNKMPHGGIDILFTVAEEIGLSGSKFTDKRFLKADFGYVLDGGDVNKIVNQAPSQDSIEVKIIGRAAHAGVHPEKGVNAIQVASQAIAGMKLGRIDSETTANIGIISGGIATNIVPESVSIKGEARSHNAGKLKRQVKHMTDAFGKACRRSGAKMYCKVTPAYRAFKISNDHRALIIAKAAARRSGIMPVVQATGGGSDANIFCSFGLPCLIIGVGADNVHTAHENISIDEFAKGAEFVVNIIKEVMTCSKRQ